MDSSTTNAVIAWLTVGLVLAAAAQAFYGFRLWKLQKEIEASRKRTSVGLGLEVRRSDPSHPMRAYLRVENASAIGVMANSVSVIATLKRGKSDSIPQSLNFAIGPYGSREVEVSQLIRDAAVKADPNDTAWQNAAHSANVGFTLYYTAEGVSLSTTGFAWRIDFSAGNFQGVGAPTQ